MIQNHPPQYTAMNNRITHSICDAKQSDSKQTFAVQDGVKQKWSAVETLEVRLLLEIGEQEDA